MLNSFDTLVVAGMMLVATFTDLRTREVPGWITLGGIDSGVVVAMMNGADAVSVSLPGMMIGVSIIMPLSLSAPSARSTRCCWRRSTPGKVRVGALDSVVESDSSAVLARGAEDTQRSPTRSTCLFA